MKLENYSLKSKFILLFNFVTIVIIGSCIQECGHYKKINIPISIKLHGLNFSPFIDGQDPTLGFEINKSQLITKLKIIAPYTSWIRTFSCTKGLEKVGFISHEMNLKTAIGAWLSRDKESNEREISNLIKMANAGFVDIAVLGSETLYRKDLTEEQLISYIQRVQESIQDTIPVTTAEVGGILIQHPKLVSTVDIIFYNHYPYWEGISIDPALNSLFGFYKHLKSLFKNKPIIISETGWPSCGKKVREAIPSIENSSLYFLNFISWANANNILYFYFEAFDETWKSNYEGPQGACWGIWDKDGNLKPGMQEVFTRKKNNYF